MSEATAPAPILRYPEGAYYRAFAADTDSIAIIRALAQKQSGMSRLGIIEATSLSEGGGTSACLEELESSGFISAYLSFEKKKKELIYRLTDEYSLFYIKFIENQQNQAPDTWQHLSQTQTFKTWCAQTWN